MPTRLTFLSFLVSSVLCLSNSGNSGYINLSLPEKPYSFCVLAHTGATAAEATGFIVTFKNKDYLLINWHELTGRETNMKIRHAIPDSIEIFSKDSHGKIVKRAYSVKDHWIKYGNPPANFNGNDIKDTLFDVVALPIKGSFTNICKKFSIDHLADRKTKLTSCFLYGYPASFVNPTPTNIYEAPKRIMSSIIILPIAPPNYFKYYQLIKWNPATLEEGLSGSPVLSPNNTFLGIYSEKLEIRTAHSDNFYGRFWNIFAIKTLLDEGDAVDWSKIR